MKHHYRISPKGQGTAPSDAEIARYRDPKRLIFNYHKAVRRDRRPIYRDPKAFIMLLLIVLMAWLLSEGGEKKEKGPIPPATTEQRP